MESPFLEPAPLTCVQAHLHFVFSPDGRGDGGVNECTHGFEPVKPGHTFEENNHEDQACQLCWPIALLASQPEVTNLPQLQIHRALLAACSLPGPAHPVASTMDLISSSLPLLCRGAKLQCGSFGE
jgi:hypothetical protein